MTGGRSRDSILSDAFEAVIGAIYLDQGIETATKFIETYLFKDVENKVLFFDAKTNLQEIVQGEGKGRLKYVLVGEEGPDHAKIFTVEARLGENVIGTGSGHSKSQQNNMLHLRRSNATKITRNRGGHVFKKY